MTGMELYAKFMFTLTVGLVGVGLVLMTILETLLLEWDPVVDAKGWWKSFSHRSSGSVSAEDILSELEGRRRGQFAPRPAIDRRREVLRDMREADDRVASPDIVEAL
jgi:hypothetical protein